MGIPERLSKLEESALPFVAATPEEMEERGWALEDQIEEVLAHLRVHMWGRSVQVATDRELYILEELIAAEVLDEGARDYFRRMDPAKQPEREAWLFAHRVDYSEEGHGA